ncbi:MAG: hypothetical protein ABI197_03210 [Granulicella sp.]
MAVLSRLKELVRTMAWLDSTTGLRASELPALRWDDIDFETSVAYVQRGIVYNVVGLQKAMLQRVVSRLPLP